MLTQCYSERLHGQVKARAVLVQLGFPSWAFFQYSCSLPPMRNGVCSLVAASCALRRAALKTQWWALRPRISQIASVALDYEVASTSTIRRAIRQASNVAIALATASSLAGAQALMHVESSLPWAQNAVSNAAVDARLRGAAAQYRSHAPVPRIAFFDIAYPKDSAEAATTRGYALLVVTAVVQDSTELPLPRVYVRSPSRDKDVPLLARVASWVPATDTNVRVTFGRFRLDALYLLRIDARTTAGDLLADFASHRQGFRLTHFAGDVPDPVRRLGAITPAVEAPLASSVWPIVRREYPDLATALGPSQ